MAPRTTFVRISSSFTEQTKEYLTQADLEHLVRYVTTHADAGIPSTEAPSIRKLPWKVDDNKGEYQIWYLMHDTVPRIDVIAFTKAPEESSKPVETDGLRTAVKLAIIARLIYRTYKLGERVVDYFG